MYKNTQVTITYLAWDTALNQGKTGDAANHTLRGIGDGTEYTPSGPSITEIDSTNCPGLYKATIVAFENNYTNVTVHGKSSTANVVIIPTKWQNETDANTALWIGKGIPLALHDGYPLIDVNYWQGTAVAQASDGGIIQSLPSIVWQTAQAGSTASTIKLNAGASATDDFYKGWWVHLTSGAGIRQTRHIISYVGSTKVATISPNWLTTPGTDNFVLIPRVPVDVGFWENVVPNALIAGRIDCNAQIVGDKTGYSLGASGLDIGVLTAAAKNDISDNFLDRNMATGTDSGTDSTAVRTARQALRILRNKASISGGTLTVTKEDDAASSWTAAVTTTAGNPISTVDPT